MCTLILFIDIFGIVPMCFVHHLLKKLKQTTKQFFANLIKHTQSLYLIITTRNERIRAVSSSNCSKFDGEYDYNKICLCPSSCTVQTRSLLSRIYKIFIFNH